MAGKLLLRGHLWRYGFGSSVLSTSSISFDAEKTITKGISAIAIARTQYAVIWSGLSSLDNPFQISSNKAYSAHKIATDQQALPIIFSKLSITFSCYTSLCA
ncbi:hypothetical protein [Serratia marcescens]|uniref:hypothetical protein n=1 Tax=Serratia marcescens TaxID=615 RepID=UPI0011B4ACF7|nr:hypothetical protein [Serratia marcescens]